MFDSGCIHLGNQVASDKRMGDTDEFGDSGAEQMLMKVVPRRVLRGGSPWESSNQNESEQSHDADDASRYSRIPAPAWMLVPRKLAEQPWDLNPGVRRGRISKAATGLSGGRRLLAIAGLQEDSTTTACRDVNLPDAGTTQDPRR